MRRLSIGVALVVVALLTLMVSTTSASEGKLKVRGSLSGFQEVTPKLSGTGTFEATIAGNQMTYTLTYTQLSTDVFMAHIHFGQRAVNGGVVVWLCGPSSSPAAKTCPAKGGTVTGVATPASVQAVSSQLVKAGDFGGLVAIIKSGDAYANVHTTQFPAGEIRGQLKAVEAD